VIARGSILRDVRALATGPFVGPTPSKVSCSLLNIWGSWFLDGILYLAVLRRVLLVRLKMMSQGKNRQKIPGSRMKILTKDAKQMVNGPYYCPKCRKELLQICVNVKTKEVFAVCKCELEWPLTFAPVFQPIDYYNKFRDAWKKQSYGIIKK
jgi:transcription elongation factor Elf1